MSFGAPFARWHLLFAHTYSVGFSSGGIGREAMHVQPSAATPHVVLYEQSGVD